jgi:hypothetical protein
MPTGVHNFHKGFAKGHVGYNLGKHLSEETKKKLSLAKKGKKTGPQSPELIEKRIASSRGRHHSEANKNQ